MDAPRTIRVMVVDDSAFMRKAVSAILNSAEDIEVVATARDGLEAVKKLAEVRPDVITLDVEMPHLDGLHTLGYIMSELPTPVVMLSAFTTSGSDNTVKALEYGAVDFVCKPSGPISLDLDKVAEEIVTKVRTAAGGDVSRLSFLEVERLAHRETGMQAETTERQVVLMASSTGGPRALYDIIPKLPADLPAAVLVVQHMPINFTRSLAERLNSVSSLKIKEAEDGDIITPGTVYIAPGSYHLLVVKENHQEVVRLNQAPPRNSVRPSADVTMEAAAKVFGKHCLAVVLTGMGKDGTAGAKRIKAAGGRVLVQDEKTSVIFGMPRSVIDAGVADQVVPLASMAEQITLSIKREAETKVE
jgi:two-component system, chemotaxis family, protein-glutamate methylesterase/glutaminase